MSYTYVQKKSFSLVSLAIYTVALGVLASVTIGTMVIIDNAKVVRTMDEMEYYERANAQFVTTYAALPGLVPYSECIKHAEFNDLCRNQNDINLTTSENVYKSELNDCKHNIGCILETNGLSGNEDILRNFLLPMRYLKTANLIDTIDIGLETQLDVNQDYSDRVWAKSRLGKNAYVNIYNYYNPTQDTSKAFLFTGQNIFGHTVNSGTAYDHHDKLLRENDQYLIYLKKSPIPQGAIGASLAKKLDKKFDDGKPLTGTMTTFSTSEFSGNFENSEYAGCITVEPTDEDSINNAEYNDMYKSNGYCNIAYRFKNLSSNIEDVSKTISVVGTPEYIDSQKCITYTDGATKCADPTNTLYQDGYQKEYTYEDGTSKSMEPVCSCNSDTGDITCRYEDGTSGTFTPIASNCTYDANGTQTCTYENQQQCDVELSTSDLEQNCTIQEKQQDYVIAGAAKEYEMTCQYVNGLNNKYNLVAKDCAQSSGTCTTGTAYNCSTFNDNIVGNCLQYQYNQDCSSSNANTPCTSGNAYSCTTLDGKIVSGSCLQYQYNQDCSNNSGTCTSSPANYSCTTLGGKIVSGSCLQYQYNQDCSNNSGTCTSSPANYSCTTLGGKIVSGSCKAITYKYCTTGMTDTSTSGCVVSNPSVQHINYCKFYGDTKQSCALYALSITRDSEMINTDACITLSDGSQSCAKQEIKKCGNTNGICSEGTEYACNTVNNIIVQCVVNDISNYSLNISNATITVAGVQKSCKSNYSGYGCGCGINGMDALSCGTPGCGCGYSEKAMHRMNFGDSICFGGSKYTCSTSHGCSFYQRPNSC